MCGIIGYIGDKETVKLLLNAIKKLQYRGYDSLGFSVIENSQLKTEKRKGKISDFEQELLSLNLKANIGIAHTRWATHGEPSKRNAHPHTSKNEIAIVHNGIIENHSALKKMLQKKGYEFSSETDSEVLAHLIHNFYHKDLEEAVSKALKLVEGAYGIAVIHKDEQKIVAAKKGSPLILGIGENENFVSSDINAILEHTKKAIYLEDNELAILTKNTYEVKKLNGEKTDKKIHNLKYKIEEIEKSNYKHFMLKEIFEQPKAIHNTFRGKLTENQVVATVNIPHNLNKIIIIGCGTSWHSALIGKYLIEKATGISVEVDYASEFRYRTPIFDENSLIITISQSGETADTLAALDLAKQKSATTLGIVNVVGSSIARKVDSGIYLHAGPEIGVASTKAFSCQITALILLAYYLKKEITPLDQDILYELKNLPSKAKEILSQSEKIREIALKLKDSQNFLYLGRGINYPVALEGALKLKEISYIHAEGYPAAEMKHGPIALIDNKMPVVFIATKDSSYQKTLSNIEEIKARNGIVITITDIEDEKLSSLSNYLIKIPKTKEELAPILNNIPLQLLAYHIADIKGIDVDKPRNLAKSVTVE